MKINQPFFAGGVVSSIALSGLLLMPGAYAGGIPGYGGYGMAGPGYGMGMRYGMGTGYSMGMLSPYTTLGLPYGTSSQDSSLSYTSGMYSPSMMTSGTAYHAAGAPPTGYPGPMPGYGGIPGYGGYPGPMPGYGGAYAGTPPSPPSQGGDGGVGYGGGFPMPISPPMPNGNPGQGGWPPPNSLPAGDTSAIAGTWSDSNSAGSMQVQVMPNGFLTSRITVNGNSVATTMRVVPSQGGTYLAFVSGDPSGMMYTLRPSLDGKSLIMSSNFTPGDVTLTRAN